ncbi:MAG: YIP1 family protein [Defluviitaleaceae bacterium]|nr:YIP1 family protein [Defluviitaleaceae bacterium]
MTAVGRYVGNIDWKKYGRELRFSLYTMRRPLDGFWDLIHEKRGSMAAAHTLVALMFITTLMWIVLTSFQFVPVNMETFNAWWTLGMNVVPIVLFSVANWCLTTLFDGKGKLSHIYMGYAYALAPQIIINIVQIPLSHVITFDEGAIFWSLSTISYLWFLLLLLCAMKEIHDYSFSKAILTSILSLAVISIMVFIFVMFFAVVSDGVAYFVSLWQEAMLRIQRG